MTDETPSGRAKAWIHEHHPAVESRPDDYRDLLARRTKVEVRLEKERKADAARERQDYRSLAKAQNDIDREKAVAKRHKARERHARQKQERIALTRAVAGLWFRLAERHAAEEAAADDE